MTNIKVEVTQINWDGKGAERTFTYWPTDLASRLERIAYAYNFASGRTRVAVNGRDVTGRVAEMKP